MSKKLTVNELRSELTKRGLSSDGFKPSLVKRLESALYDELRSSKRSKHEEAEGTEESESDRPEKKKKVRSHGQVEKDSETGLLAETKEGEYECEDNSKAVAVSLDEHVPEEIKKEYRVFQQGNDVYDALLNQTNIGGNNNKFFVIQLLESNSGGKFLVYNRWGRVGVNGQQKISGPYTTQEGAVKEFEAKFFSKTSNRWWNRRNFVTHSKYYTWLEMDYNKEGKEQSDAQSEVHPVTSIPTKETKLDPRIAKFVSLICDIGMMRRQMEGIGYNAKRLPLNKLSKSTILKAYDALKKIGNVIDNQDREKLEQLSGEFYTIIPHDFGFKKVREFTIDTHFKVMEKLKMVEALGEIEAANSLLNKVYQTEDPLYAHYQCLNCELTPLNVDSREHSMIRRYIQNTNENDRYNIEVVQLFKASRKGESERFQKFAQTKNRKLLWHGSRLTNWTGILSQGLRIAPPEAPVNGYAFGKGVYFADMFSKSAAYSWPMPYSDDNGGVLILCEVALGDMAELYACDFHADKLPPGKLSTRGVGRVAPDPTEDEVVEDGLTVPLGKPVVDSIVTKCGCYHNEYIVYDVGQIKMRYVVHLKYVRG